MAELTANLPSESGYGLRNPPSNGVADAVGGLVDNVGNMFALSRRGSQKAQAQDTLDAQNELATGVFDRLAEADKSRVPDDTQQALGSLNTIRTAEKSGRIPLGSLNLNVEQFVQDTMHKHPDSAAAIFTYAKSHGFDHYLFQGIEAEQKYNDTVTSAKAQQDASMVQLGRSTNPKLEDSDAMQLGYTISGEQAKMKAAQDAAEAALKNQEISDKRRKAILEDSDRTVFNGTMTLLGKQANPIMDDFFKFLDASMDAPDFDKKVRDSIPNMQLAFESIRSKAHAIPGMTKESQTLVDSWIDSQEKALKDVTTGDLSNWGQTKKGAEYIKDKLAVDTATAYPMASKLKSLLGPGWITLFGGDPTYSLPAETLAALKSEMKDVKLAGGIDTPVGQATIQEIASIAKGKMNISDIPASRIAGVVKGSMGVLKGSQDAIVNKSDTSLNNQNVWSNTYTKLLNAARSIQPNSQDIDSFSTATQSLFNPGARTVIRNYLANSDSKEHGEQLVTGSRAVASQLLFGLQKQSFGQYKAEYDDKRGEFVVKAPGPGGSSPMTEPGIAGIAFQSQNSDYTAAKKQAGTANALLDHLIQTDQYDSNMPAGATPISRRNYWVQNDPRKLQDAKGQSLFKKPEGEGSAAGFDKQLTEFNKRLRNIPLGGDSAVSSSSSENSSGDFPVGQEEYSDYVRYWAEKKGVPEDLAVALFGQESGYDPNAKAGTSSATGIGQITKGTAKELGIDPKNPWKSIPAALGYLAKRKGSGDWISALEGYGTLARSNWPDDEKGQYQYERTVEKFRKLLSKG